MKKKRSERIETAGSTKGETQKINAGKRHRFNTRNAQREGRGGEGKCWLITQPKGLQKKKKEADWSAINAFEKSKTTVKQAATRAPIGPRTKSKRKGGGRTRRPANGRRK